MFEEIGPNVHSAVAEVSSGRPVSASTPKAFEKELLTALKQSAAGDAGQPVPKEVTVGAKAFMAKERLFGTNPEGQIDANTRARWGGLKIVTVEGKQFVVMNRIIETKYDGDTEWKGSVPGDLVNVVAMKKNAAGQFVFDKFENAVAVPKTLTVALGCNYSNRGSKDQYYGVVEGKDVVEVLKSVYGATPVSGATIQVEKGAKAEFDPTVGRKWRTTSLHYALDRGSSAEILDGRPHQLDEDFNGYYHSTQGKFAPWLFGQVRGVFVAGKWKAALPLTPMPRT